MELTAFVYDPVSLYPNTYWQQYTSQFRNKFNPELTGLTGGYAASDAVPEYLPFVGRAQAVYANQGVNTWDPLRVILTAFGSPIPSIWSRSMSNRPMRHASPSR